MEFTALTLTKDNRVASLSITARDEADARAQLARNGLFVSSLRARHSGLLQAASSHPGRDRRFNLVLFSQELLALLQAGLGVVEAIEALAEKESQPLAAAVMGQLLEGLREGRRLSMVLADRPEVFTPLFVGMVRTAEGTSDLPSALSRFIDHSQKVSVVRNKLVSASIYPVARCPGCPACCWTSDCGSQQTAGSRSRLRCWRYCWRPSRCGMRSTVGA